MAGMCVSVLLVLKDVVAHTRRKGLMAVKPIPEGYTSITPYLTVDDGKGAIEFYKRAFGATERGAMVAPDGKIAHAELQIADAVVMLSDSFPEFTTKTPKELGGTSVAVFLYVEDVDSVVQAAAEAGATIAMEPEDQFWGDRLGHVIDPFGHVWLIATRVENLTPEEIEARSREAFAAMGAAA
jgi:PhnB protein